MPIYLFSLLYNLDFLLTLLVMVHKMHYPKLLRMHDRVRWDCPDPVGTGIKIPTFNGVGTGNPVKTGIGTTESRGITLLDSKSG